MAAMNRLLFLSLLLALIAAKAEVSPLGENEVSALNIELSQLKSRIKELEFEVDERTKASNAKDAIIAEKEKIIEENSDHFSSLQNEIVALHQAERRSTFGTVIACLEFIIKGLWSGIRRCVKLLVDTIKHVEIRRKLGTVISCLKHIMLRYVIPSIKTLWLGLRTLAEPLVEAIKTKVIPSVNGSWSVIKAFAQPHIETIKTVDLKSKLCSVIACLKHIILRIVFPSIKEAFSMMKTFAEPHIEIIKTLEIRSTLGTAITSLKRIVLQRLVPSLRQLWSVIRRFAEPKGKEVYETCKTSLAPLVFQGVRKYSKLGFEKSGWGSKALHNSTSSCFSPLFVSLQI